MIACRSGGRASAYLGAFSGGIVGFAVAPPTLALTVMLFVEVPPFLCAVFAVALERVAHCLTLRRSI